MNLIVINARINSCEFFQCFRLVYWWKINSVKIWTKKGSKFHRLPEILTVVNIGASIQ